MSEHRSITDPYAVPSDPSAIIDRPNVHHRRDGRSMRLHRYSIDRLSTWALISSVCGALAEVSLLPHAARAVLLSSFMFVGPGAIAIAFWSKELSRSALLALVPLLSLSIVILIVTMGLFMGYWSSRTTLAGMAAVTAALALINRNLESRDKVSA